MNSFKAALHTKEDREVVCTTIVVADTPEQAMVQAVYYFHCVRGFNPVDSSRVSLERIYNHTPNTILDRVDKSVNFIESILPCELTTSMRSMLNSELLGLTTSIINIKQTEVTNA